MTPDLILEEEEEEEEEEKEVTNRKQSLFLSVWPTIYKNVENKLYSIGIWSYMKMFFF